MLFRSVSQSRYVFSGWELSKDGIRRNISDDAIVKLLIQEDHQVPYV